MRIGDRPNSQPVTGPQTNRAGGKSAAGTTGSSSGARRASSVDPSVTSEFVGRLKALPDVRADVVADVERRLNEGLLLTRDAAERTAEALLADLSSYSGTGEV